jgi:hypothetical protein
MSTESLINNIDYNTKMDKNVSILSDTESVLPEDLSYAITINMPNQEIPVPNNRTVNACLVLKINILIIVCVVSLLGILYL